MNTYAAYHVLYGGVDPWGLCEETQIKDDDDLATIIKKQEQVIRDNYTGKYRLAEARYHEEHNALDARNDPRKPPEARMPQDEYEKESRRLEEKLNAYQDEIEKHEEYMIKQMKKAWRDRNRFLPAPIYEHDDLGKIICKHRKKDKDLQKEYYPKLKDLRDKIGGAKTTADKQAANEDYERLQDEFNDKDAKNRLEEYDAFTDYGRKNGYPDWLPDQDE